MLSKIEEDYAKIEKQWICGSIPSFLLHQLQTGFFTFKILAHLLSPLAHRWFLHPLSRWNQLLSPTCCIFRWTHLCFSHSAFPSSLQSSVPFVLLLFFRTLLCHHAAKKLSNSWVSSVLSQLPAVLTNVAVLYLFTPTSICLFSPLFSPFLN